LFRLVAANAVGARDALPPPVLKVLFQLANLESKFPALATEARELLGYAEALGVGDVLLLATSQAIEDMVPVECPVDCSVCMDGNGSAASIVLPCMHVLHKECVLKWFAQGKHTCPACKTSVFSTHCTDEDVVL
jgi:Ring finger domain